MDPQALTGEMFALATNQLEPVQAQKFVPYLTQGIQISLQDQMNEVTAQARAAERLARGNPEALAMIAAQAYDAKNRIKGEEFRLNQGEKQRVAETNRQVLNEANKMNLGIMDQQYVRQQTAKSKTKEQAITALNSISDKILKNKLENRELGIYENLYGFRFGPNGQAYNTNLTTFNTPTVGQGATSLYDLTPLEKKKVLDDARKAKTTQTATAGQGAIVKSMHEL
jgi:predicted ATPase